MVGCTELLLEGGTPQHKNGTPLPELASTLVLWNYSSGLFIFAVARKQRGSGFFYVDYGLLMFGLLPTRVTVEVYGIIFLANNIVQKGEAVQLEPRFGTAHPYYIIR